MIATVLLAAAGIGAGLYALAPSLPSRDVPDDEPQPVGVTPAEARAAWLILAQYLADAGCGEGVTMTSARTTLANRELPWPPQKVGK